MIANFVLLMTRLNQQLLVSLRRSPIQFAVDDSESIHYSSDEEESFEEILANIRETAFPSWQVLSCPADSTDLYRKEMHRRAVPYHEEVNNGAIEFLLSREHRPHSWRLG